MVSLQIPGIEKLVELTASGIGAIGGPMLARWKARVAAEVAVIEAKGRADALLIDAQGHTNAMRHIIDAQDKARANLSGLSFQGKVNIKNEIQSRISYQEQKRQNNLQNVVELAAHEINGKMVDDVDIDHDWASRFFADVQDVTSEKLQSIWAKILAGEVESPGRTSLHTLSVLRNFTQNDAKLFERLCQFVIMNFILRETKYTDSISEFPSVYDFLTMENYGLISTSYRLERILDFSSTSIPFFDETMVYRITKVNSSPSKINIPAFILSPQGIELYRMIPSTINNEFLGAFAKFVKDNGKFRLERATILERLSDERVRHGPWVPVEPRSIRA